MDRVCSVVMLAGPHSVPCWLDLVTECHSGRLDGVQNGAGLVEVRYGDPEKHHWKKQISAWDCSFCEWFRLRNTVQE